jgi:hypothetical protein
VIPEEVSEATECRVQLGQLSYVQYFIPLHKVPVLNKMSLAIVEGAPRA